MSAFDPKRTSATGVSCNMSHGSDIMRPPLGLFPLVQSTIFSIQLNFTVANCDARDGRARTPAFTCQQRTEGRSPAMTVSRKIWFGLMGLFAAMMVVVSIPAAAQQQQRRPNILVIMGDDVGWFNIGAYHRGMMAGRTPNID